MDESLRAEVSQRDKWMRLLYIVIYAVLFQLAEILLGVVVILQFLIHLVTGAPNPGLREFGHRTGKWLRQVVHFVSYASEERPWPFGQTWPDAFDLPEYDD